MKRGTLQSTGLTMARMLLGLASLAFLASPSWAVLIPIANHSFEDPGIPDPPADPFIGGLPTGWNDLGSDGPFVELHSALGFTGGDTLQYGGLNGGGIYQDLGVQFQAGMTYQVDIAGAHRSNFTNGVMEFGVMSSNDLGVDLGTPGFIDIQGIWSGSGNPDGDDMYNLFRDASVLNGIGSGALGRTSTFTVGGTVPTGNIVVFIRQTGGFRINFDNIRLEELSGIVLGDVTGEGDVDLLDYGIIRDNFRTNVASRGLGDLSGDGYVDFVDFLEWRNNSPFAGLSFAELDALSSSVPEPSAAVIALAGLASALSRRRRG